MDAIRTVIRYSFTQTEEDGPRVSGLITVSLRRLPRQVDSLEVEISALTTLGRYASGVFLPRDS